MVRDHPEFPGNKAGLVVEQIIKKLLYQNDCGDLHPANTGMRQVKVYKEEEEVSESEDERETKTMHTKADKETLSDEDCDDDMLLG